jgi:hypothetical protein
MSNSFYDMVFLSPGESSKAQRSLDALFAFSRVSFHQNLARAHGNQAKSLAKENNGHTTPLLTNR